MGRRSKGCEPCLRRKIKCDETHPECLNCQLSDRSCPGPVVGRIFLECTPEAKTFKSQYQSKSKKNGSNGPAKTPARTARVKSLTEYAHPAIASTRRDSVSPGAGVRLLSKSSKPALDPFDSLPIRLDRTSEVLIEIYLFHFSRKVSTMGPSSQWLPLALADPVLLETTLFVAASFYKALSKSVSNVILFQHKAALIRLINNRLGDEEARVSDSMICAVSLLSGSEGISGAFHDYKVHIEGLQHIIMQRGGLHCLTPNSSALKMALAAYSYGACRFQISGKPFIDYAARTMHLLPHFHSLPPSIPLSPLSALPSAPYSPPTSPITSQYPTVRVTLPNPLLNCLQILQQTTTLISGSHFKHFPATTLSSFDDLLTTLEFQFCSLSLLPANPGPPFPGPPFPPWTPQQETIILAAFLFTSIFLRERPVAALVHKDIFHRADGHLKSSLDDVDEEGGWRAKEERALLLWVLIVLGSVAMDEPGREKVEWYVFQTREVLTSLGLWGEEWWLIERCLGRTAWSKGLGRFVEGIWGRVSQAEGGWETRPDRSRRGKPAYDHSTGAG